MAQAYSQHGRLSREMADQVDADAGFMRCAGAGRDDDALRVHGFDFRHCDLIVAADFDFCAQFAEILDEVVREGIVVIEDENHDRWRRASDLGRPPLLSDYTEGWAGLSGDRLIPLTAD